MTGVKLIRPVPDKFEISATFRQLTDKYGKMLWGPAGHRGIDLACPMMTPVLAPQAGVAKILQSDGLGLHVEVMRGPVEVTIDGATYRGPAVHRLCHLDQTKVAHGAAVEQGQFLGYSGNSGRRRDGEPMPPHLHEELEIGGVFVDPSKLWTVGPFPDVMPEDPAAEDIAYCRSHALDGQPLMGGGTDGLFRPDGTLSRRQAASLTARLDRMSDWRTAVGLAALEERLRKPPA